MAEQMWLLETGKWLGGIAAGWFGKVLVDRQRTGSVRRSLYKEMAHNPVTLDMLSADAEPSDDERLQGLVKSLLRTSYYEHATKERATFDELEDAYTIEAVYRAFEWISKDVSFYPSGVVHSRILGALNVIRYDVAAGALSRRLLLGSTPKLQRNRLKQMLSENSELVDSLRRLGEK